MSVVVVYPAEVKQYLVSVARQSAEIVLRGIDDSPPTTRSGKAKITTVGLIKFGDPNPISDKDFITRGGFLRMDRPMTMFSAIIDILRNEKPLFLHGDGTLSTSFEPVGEEEGK
jgi:hypothetical protein